MRRYSDPSLNQYLNTVKLSEFMTVRLRRENLYIIRVFTVMFSMSSGCKKRISELKRVNVGISIYLMGGSLNGSIF